MDVRGLTSAEAVSRLLTHGENRIPERRHHPVLRFLGRLWAPVPWMLEAALLLELALGRRTQAVIILVLLLLNATVAFFEERHVRSALDLLRVRLTIQARVRRDGEWRTLAAALLVPGDLIHVRMGDVVPADLRLVEGHLSIDQSALTGESSAVDADAGGRAFSGSVALRGEATAEVTATGPSSFYGRTAELVRTARATGHLEGVILRIVRFLVIADVALVAVVLVRALTAHVAVAETLPFALMLLIASVPVALPATFTLATAVGAHDLARRGVLVSRLSAIEEAASMDVLCSDKTGTLTENRLALASLRPLSGYSEITLLELSAVASEAETQDPIDLAILAVARERGLDLAGYERLEVVPFDPATKRAEVVARHAGRRLRVIKGAPHAVFGLARDVAGADEEVVRLGERGERVLAVAVDDGERLVVAGLLGFIDPPRPDARQTIAALRGLGVRTVMVTGDGAPTARAVAAQIGIVGPACDRRRLRAASPAEIAGAAVFAEVLPEDKIHLVETLQRAGHVVGMTGDGVNDAPALKQAEVGIALANATDVAKASASIILTRPGLTDVAPAVHVGRQVYQRLLTYTLNKVIKTFHVTLFLSAGFLLFGTFVLAPRHIVLLLLTNDFVTMSIARDRAVASPRPDRWNVRHLSASALVLALGWVAFSFGVLLAGRDLLHLDPPRLQTLNFLALAFSGQATVYMVRERRHLFRSRPSGWVALATAGDLVTLAVLAGAGVLVAPIGPWLVAGVLGCVLVAGAVIDLVKVAVFRRTGMA